MKCFITNRECRYDVPYSNDQSEGEIFMISPFGFPFDDLYKHGIEPAVKKMHKAIARADQSLQLGYVMCQRICRRILSASSLFVDLSIPNGNVYYELGLGYGLGRSIVFFKAEKSSSPYINAFESANAKISSYCGLDDFVGANQMENFMKAHWTIPNKIKSKLQISSPDVVLGDPPIILNVVNDNCPTPDFHEHAIKNAMKYYNTLASKSDIESKSASRKLLENWSVDTLVVDKKLDIEMAATRLGAAKICVFDMTHYEQGTNAYIFFLLGLAHACEREVIPVINRPINRSVPFDIRGLWQVNFEKVEELQSELAQILPTIDADFKKERSDYLYSQIWDSFLRDKHVHIITCAREAAHDEDRGKRTNVDKWDFTSVSELSFFIPQKYETAEVEIEEPKNKKSTSELKRKVKKEAFHKKIREELADKDCVIIGSPDVSDYAEVVLSDLHNISPHLPKQNADQLPFVFYKKTKNPGHPRAQSSFYQIPREGQHDRVEFGGQEKTRVECIEYQDDQPNKRAFRGHSCVIVTIARNPYSRNINGPHKYVMIICGFTGIATYAATKLLTDPAPVFREQLHSFIERRNTELQEQPLSSNVIHLLVGVDYKKDADEISTGDTRELVGTVVKEVMCVPFHDCRKMTE